MEGSERKDGGSSEMGEVPLPPGWTEHVAPTGHKYYYHKESKRSTYTRPEPEIRQDPSVGLPERNPGVSAAQYPTWTVDYSGQTNGCPNPTAVNYNPYPVGIPPTISYNTYPGVGVYAAQQSVMTPAHSSAPQTSFSAEHRRPRIQAQDRPKRKEAILNCAPWVLVYTRLGRRFVHNTATGQSLWKFPAEIMEAVITHDVQRDKSGLRDAKKRVTGANGVTVGKRVDGGAVPIISLKSDQSAVPEGDAGDTLQGAAKATDRESSESEYEEIEVTDDESDDQNADDDGSRAGTASNVQDQDEFQEADIEYQLRAMNEQFDGQPGHDDQHSDEDGIDPHEVFCQLLDDWGISPFTPWSSIIESPPLSEDKTYDLLSDERFTVLASSKLRKEAFESWARTRIARKHALETMERTDGMPAAGGAGVSTVADPRSKYLSFLHEKTTSNLDPHGHGGKTRQSPSSATQLYWAEFKRKFKREEAMKDAPRSTSGSGIAKPMGEREREEIYRAHIARITKLSLEQRKEDMMTLLKTLAPDSRSKDELPIQVTGDIRYISLAAEHRDEVLKRHFDASNGL